MSIEEEALQNLNILERTFDSERSQAILRFAKAHDFAKRTICCPDGSVHPASEYAVQMNCNSAALLGDLKEDFFESLSTVCILLAMEETRPSFWTPGAEMLYDVRQAGIVLTRQEVSAFLAQLGNSTNTSEARAKLLYKGPLVTAIYCGRLLTLYGSLTSTFSIHAPGSIPDEIEAKFNACWAETPAASIEAMLNTFVPAYLGAECESRLMTFINWLRKRGFYTAPADTTGALACEGGLAMHTTNLISRHLSIERPQTEKEFGRVILVDVLSSLRRSILYKKEWSDKKVFCSDGNLTEADGRKYRMERQVSFYEDDTMPYGEGRTSLHMANGYFGGLMPKEIAAAIDCCASDESENPHIGTQMIQYPLGLSLHIANTMVRNLDDPATFD